MSHARKKNYFLLKLMVFTLLISTEQLYSQIEKLPCPRNQPVVAYHSKAQRIFLFGGFCSATKKRLNDLWKFDGEKWESVSSKNAPAPRSGHTMIYDSLRDRLIVFGGKNQQRELLNDLWAWDGTNWTLLSNEGPTPRQSHRMVFNNENGDFFLFGGSNSAKQSLNDTWVFRKGAWKKLTSPQAPPPRLQHTLAYDDKRKKVILFGGFDRTEKGKIVYGDIWEWSVLDGWVFKDKNEKMARDHHAMVYDPVLKGTILFGGYYQGYLGDTWIWNGEKWLLKTDNGPARAGKPGLLYDTNKKRAVLFGGGNNENMYLMDFWEFNSPKKTWNKYLKN